MFVSELLPKMIHHRNQLKAYRVNIKKVNKVLNTVEMEIDFSKNLNVPIKEKPQELVWSNQQLTVHTGIVRNSGNKLYHILLG